MPELRLIVAALVAWSVFGVLVGAGATATVSRGTLAIHVMPADIDQPTPPDCEGLSFAETIIGTDRNDVINVGDAPTLVLGLGGRDIIIGGSAGDCLVGGQGSDWVTGRGGDDVVVGEAGNDRLGGGEGSDRILGGPGNDRLFGAELARDDDGDDDTIRAVGHVAGRAPRGPSFETDTAIDLMDGGAGRDRCFGSALDAFVGCERVFLGRPGHDGESQPVDEWKTPRKRGVPDPGGTAGPTPPSVRVGPTPSGDPDPTPDASPGPTPEILPEPTPESTPAPTPDPTPEPTPEPTPDPTPEPTPDPTLEPTPDPTPGPTPSG